MNQSNFEVLLILHNFPGFKALNDWATCETILFTRYHESKMRYYFVQSCISDNFQKVFRMDYVDFQIFWKKSIYISARVTHCVVFLFSKFCFHLLRVILIFNLDSFITALSNTLFKKLLSVNNGFCIKGCVIKCVIKNTPDALKRDTSNI